MHFHGFRSSWILDIERNTGRFTPLSHANFSSVRQARSLAWVLSDIHCFAIYGQLSIEVTNLFVGSYLPMGLGLPRSSPRIDDRLDFGGELVDDLQSSRAADLCDEGKAARRGVSSRGSAHRLCY